MITRKRAQEILNSYDDDYDEISDEDCEFLKYANKKISEITKSLDKNSTSQDKDMDLIFTKILDEYNQVRRDKVLKNIL